MYSITKLKDQKDSSWHQSGDVNYMKYSGTFVRKTEADCFDVIKIINLSDACGEDGWYLGKVNVCLIDSWIDIPSILNFMGWKIGDYDDYDLAEAIVDYYGFYNCNGEEFKETDEEKVKEYLHSFDII